MKKVIIEWQMNFGGWQRYTCLHHYPSAYRTAENRARSTKKRHRIVDEEGNLLDLIEP
tara:strand:+ start:1313 stop:1486 length:174 start_codon:yes stop_codon:yes gene_type:complete